MSVEVDQERRQEACGQESINGLLSMDMLFWEEDTVKERKKYRKD